ncbi:hypothetical protein TREMEDRAFT_32780 [Tremella mesenterica DSM 1558]|uniref:uncharacterized protein n=1 Tax=Tremella mesenterica (strain ATCC 24925 / CBS 8224 / DSM 1558 / NBRC 9311 / NRRL Y-6157 / RJB 2259-6 / UBC 559-6) TaxID=578456 RepID=UPI0003F496DE|nr:uncharacterized protein TREMEDRAFT_32780 [Tremella mesenterica DSM 1558]EIW67967.1 hypothetical protein TREMEDRAFT_32780 [Tremella mesenterica DSM 1558]
MASEIPLDIEEKVEVTHVESKSDIDGIDWTHYGDDPDTIEAYKTIMSWSPEERAQQEKRLVRKLDVIVMAMAVLMYILNYLDRNSIAQARVSGLTESTHITPNQYSLVNGIFYILAQTPANMILSKSRPSVFLPVSMCAWALISTCTAATKSFGTLLAVRFILGFAEAPFFPGAAYWLTCWYTKAEIGRRYAIYVGGICISSAFAGLISAGIISNLDGKQGIAGWQWIFIIEGTITVAVAIFVSFFIPDYPQTARRFKPIERVLARMRIDSDGGPSDIGGEPTMFQGFILAVKDYRTWCLGTLQLCITNMIGFNFFYPTLMGLSQGMGYKNKITILLLSAPPYMVALLFSFCESPDITRKRVLHWEISFAVTAVALILLIALAKVDSPGGRYASTYILAMGSFAAYSVAYPWVGSLMPRPMTKRASAIGIANSLSNVGAFLSSYVFYAELGPTYRTSWCIVLGMTAYSAAMVWFLGWQNKKRNAE